VKLTDEPFGVVAELPKVAAGVEYVMTTVAAGLAALSLSTDKVIVFVVTNVPVVEITMVACPFASATGFVVGIVASIPTTAFESAIAAENALLASSPVTVAVKEVTASEALYVREFAVVPVAMKLPCAGVAIVTSVGSVAE